ncbi:MAG: beta-ketoacyl-[acyl-carrier-protein] synthase family protein [Parvularculaceae bacterium]|nr:MAG: beta-ketoacyl-[acyl-carrier-protein] synthase family protein [Parvularculaceae bacterium]
MNGKGRRVVVTGLGAVCATGANVDEFWANGIAATCGTQTRTIRANDGTQITTPVAQVDGFAERAASLGRDIGRADAFSKFAAAAADEAVADSGIDFDNGLGGRTATIIGTGIGGQSSLEDGYINMLSLDKRPHPLTILRLIPNAAASHLSIRFGLRGPAFAISSACASGAHSIGVAADLIRAGTSDAAIAGASEAIITKGALQAWKAMHILSDELCRPFSKNRKGLIIGEGAGILVLEEYEHARARGAKIYAEIVGFGMNSDGKDMINPAVEGAADAMRMALGGVQVPSAENIYINAHGTGTLMNDPTETKAIRSVFGADADDLVVSSTKAMHGHLLGAAGGVESIMAIKAIQSDIVPPTINYDVPDPECDLDIVPNEARNRRVDLAISNSFAFGGLNAVVAFGRV